MKKLKDFFSSLWIFVILSLPLIIAVGIFVAWLVALFKYGSMPVSDIPAWAFWLLRCGK